MGRYNDALNQINQHNDEPSAFSQCQAYGCKLSVPNIPGKGHFCSYHEDRNQFHSDVGIQELTRAISTNMRWVNGYRKMSYWSGDDWSKYSKMLQQQEFCPMHEGELPSAYMNRFYDELDSKIFSEAKS